MDFIIGSGNLFLKYATQIASKIRLVASRGTADAPASHAFTSDSAMELADLTTSAGKITEVRLIKTIATVPKNTAQDTTLVLCCLN